MVHHAATYPVVLTISPNSVSNPQDFIRCACLCCKVPSSFHSCQVSSTPYYVATVLTKLPVVFIRLPASKLCCQVPSSFQYISCVHFIARYLTTITSLCCLSLHQTDKLFYQDQVILVFFSRNPVVL